MKNDLKKDGSTAELKAQLSFMANTNVGKYKISKKEQYKVLKKLQQNSDIIITRHDKGNSVVILNKFLVYLNTKHPSIKFTMELEVNKIIPFLDVLISSQDGSLRTSVYRKSTFMGFMNFMSFTPMYYKLGLIKTLIDRVYNICCDRKTFDLEIKKVREYLCKNSYPSTFN